MAKGLRSKAQRRLRTIRREHHWETRGKFDQQNLAAKLHNPYYDFKSDYQKKPNAFVEPENPLAIFPQIAKPDIMDFRSHRMAKGGLGAVNTFRKMHSETAKKSKYTSVVRTAEEIEAEEQNKDQQMDVEIEEVKKPSAKKNKNYTIDDIMELDSKLKISKTKAVPVQKTKQIYKNERKPQKKAKKSQKIVKF